MIIKNTRMILAALMVFSASCGGEVAEKNYAGNQQYSSGHYEAALRAYQAAQVAAPNRPEAYYNAASAYVGMNDLYRAQTALDKALETADDGLAAKAYYNLGNVYFYMGRYEESVEAYQQTLLLDPNDQDARYNLEIALLRYIRPTPTAQEQQTEPQQDESDPETTPTNQPGGFEGPTPTPPPLDYDHTATPISGQGIGGHEDSHTPMPRSQGRLTIEQAERLLDRIRQDQQALRELLQYPASSGQTSERDW